MKVIKGKMKMYKLSVLFSAFVLNGFLLFGCGEEVSHNQAKPVTEDSLSTRLDTFPQQCNPLMVGKRLTDHFINIDCSTKRKSGKYPRYSFWGNVYSTNTPNHVTYPDACAWLGALWFAEKAGEDELYDGVVAKFAPLFNQDKNMQPSLHPNVSNIVDYYIFGAIPLEIYKKKKEDRYLELGLTYADGQWTLPENATVEQRRYHEEGYSWQTRVWLDDMFMITALQIAAYQATGNENYLERTANEMVYYLERIQEPSGLFYHATNAHYYWARGNGWAAVGMAEMLKLLPENHKHKKRILRSYMRMMDALVCHQMDSGMWSQLVNDHSVWPESSGSAMFTYALITGVKNGWLKDEKYAKAARKGWIELVSYLDQNYDLKDVCEGTGAKNDYDWYKERRKWVGDLHGQAGMLWCAYALIEPAK